MKSEHYHNLTNKNEIKSPQDNGPMEQLSHSSGRCQAQFHHKWAAPRASLNVVWGGVSGQAGLPWKATLSQQPVPSKTACACCTQMLWFAPPAGATDWLWQTLSILLAQQMLSISGRCTPHSFSAMNWELLPFPPPPSPSLSAPQPWASCHSSGR